MRRFKRISSRLSSSGLAEKIPSTLRRRSTPFVAGGVFLAGVGLMATNLGGSELLSSSTPTLPQTVSVQAVSTSALADQAAIAWVDANASGSGTAVVLKTEPDTEGPQHLAVFDVSIIAPNFLTYVVHVEASNYGVLSANLAEHQTTTSSTTTSSTTSTTAASTTTTVAPTTTTSPPSGASAADQAAIAWVDANAAGSGTAQILKTDPEFENMVYEIKVVAPNSQIYEIKVSMTSGSVVSAKPSDSNAQKTDDAKEQQNSDNKSYDQGDKSSTTSTTSVSSDAKKSSDN